MTRINAFIRPADLTDKHLLAEHREIKRIPNTIKSGKARIENIPEQFTLGKGHVKFFYNKIGWLFDRYKDIYYECLKRGFNVEYYGEAFNIDINSLYLMNDLKPPPEEEQRVKNLLEERINLRLQGVK